MGIYSNAAKQARQITNKQLKSRISSLNAMDDKQVQKLFPKKMDKEKFLKLMAEVEKETTDAEKAAFIKQNIATYAPVIVKSLKHFI